jgi:hypothetical protein
VMLGIQLVAESRHQLYSYPQLALSCMLLLRACVASCCSRCSCLAAFVVPLGLMCLQSATAVFFFLSLPFQLHSAQLCFY